VLTSEFDFDLPDRLIAQQPVERGASRLLVLQPDGGLEHSSVADLPRWLESGDLLVVNDTKVIPARLFARRAPAGGRVELLLVERLATATWTCLAKPGRKARPGTILEFERGVRATVLSKEPDGTHRLEFSEPLESHLEAIGVVPLPPYIKRAAATEDRSAYQTIFATEPGAIAAPTAGLHFTPDLLSRLAEHGVEHCRITLHVGIGTFKPVTARLAHEHRMDAERFEIGVDAAAAIERTRAAGGRIVAVGTTVVRTLEGAALAHGTPIVERSGVTDLFIRPGFRFQVVDALLTNFHLPRSTLLMLVSAFAGRNRIRSAYEEAVANDYRFYSYGDAMLITARGNPGSD
jgi:S-adenosylmethionine:tRNA ribosyltransferase-isomerase